MICDADVLRGAGERVKIKLCGMMTSRDIELVNELKPDLVGFVFAEKSRRYVTVEKVRELRTLLIPQIKAVGVFVNEQPERIAELLKEGIIDLAQLHGNEDTAYIQSLRRLTNKPFIQAFSVRSKADVKAAEESLADMVLLDAGAGGGTVFDWELIRDFKRSYLLAGGLTPENVSEAVTLLQPFGVDVSSGIEIDKRKNKERMAAFIAAVRKAEGSYGR